MKLSPRQIDDLLTLVDHARRDISYGAGGTYVDLYQDDEVYVEEIKKAERAIELIKKIIIERE